MSATSLTFSAPAAPNSRAVLWGSVIARLPLAMLSVSLLVHAQQQTGSFAVAGAVSGAYAVAAAASAPLLGRWVDRRGQTRPLLLCAGATAALLILTGAAPAHTAGAVLVALGAGTGLATPPVQACVRTLLPALVARPSDLPRLFAVESTAIELTFVLGPPLSLGLAAMWSPGAALIACGLLILAGTSAFSAQPISRAWRPRALQERASGGALRSAAIRTLVAIDVATGLVFGATEVGVTAAAKHLTSAAAAGPVLGLWGAGSLLGGIIATRRGGGAQTMRGLAGLLAALAGLHGALMLVAHDLAGMAAVITLAGAIIAPMAASIYAMVGHAAPDGTATEAFSWLYAASATGAAIGAALAGILSETAGAGAAFGLGGAAGAVAVVVALTAAR